MRSAALGGGDGKDVKVFGGPLQLQVWMPSPWDRFHPPAPRWTKKAHCGVTAGFSSCSTSPPPCTHTKSIVPPPFFLPFFAGGGMLGQPHPEVLRLSPQSRDVCKCAWWQAGQMRGLPPYPHPLCPCALSPSLPDSHICPSAGHWGRARGQGAKPGNQNHPREPGWLVPLCARPAA